MYRNTIGFARRGAVVAIVGVLFVAGFGLWFMGPEAGNGLNGVNATVAAEHADHGLEPTVDATGKVVWTCSMHPQVQLPEPGKCPICFMDLIPLQQDAQGEAVSLRQISLTEQARKLAEIETAPVVRESLRVRTRMVGKVDYDETRMGTITAWVSGRIDKLHIDYTGSKVRRGQPMASIYSPELLTAQAELIEAVKARKNVSDTSLQIIRDTAARTEKAAREKLRLLGLSEAQVQRVVDSGKSSDHITLYAPMSGVVIKKDVVEGVYVKTGTPIYTIADLSRVWVILEAYESDLPWIDMGSRVQFSTESQPGRQFSGRVVYIDPVVNEKTRTVRVRLEVDNRDMRLKPGMFVRAVQRAEAETGDNDKLPLVIPATAPLVTGKRAVVYVAVDGKQGVYEGREVVLGPRAGNRYVVEYGLSEGEQVVVRGNFKIDSAVQIIARPSMMNPGPGAAAQSVDDGTAAAAEAGNLKYQLSPYFLSKLVAVSRAYEAVQQAAGDLGSADSGVVNMQQAREAFDRLLASLESIKETGLKDDGLLQWKELSMLLRNDAVLGGEATTPGRLARVARETGEHYQRLDSTFGVTMLARALNTRLDAPQPFRDALARVYRAYADLTKALTNDNLAAAQAASTAVASALHAVDAESLPMASSETWGKVKSVMISGLSAMREAGDIVAVRAGYEPLSMGLIDAVDRFGVDVGGPVFEIFCPMAFDFKGAKWLQNSEDVTNPYFGQAMLKCGEVQRQLSSADAGTGQ